MRKPWEKPLFTGWTQSVAAMERDVLTTGRFEVARPSAPQEERCATPGTDRTIRSGGLVPIGSHTLHRHILEHACAQGGEVHVERQFDFPQARFRMLQAPLTHPG